MMSRNRGFVPACPPETTPVQKESFPMNMHTPQSLPDAEVFSGSRPISLADVVALAEAGLDGTAAP